jgi:hypothetical protein
MNPLCSKLIEDLPKDAQPNIRSLTVDSSLRVKVRPALTAGASATRRLMPAPLCRARLAPFSRWATAPPSS